MVRIYDFQFSKPNNLSISLYKNFRKYQKSYIDIRINSISNWRYYLTLLFISISFGFKVWKMSSFSFFYRAYLHPFSCLKEKAFSIDRLNCSSYALLNAKSMKLWRAIIVKSSILLPCVIHFRYLQIPLKITWPSSRHEIIL